MRKKAGEVRGSGYLITKGLITPAEELGLYLQALRLAFKGF